MFFICENHLMCARSIFCLLFSSLFLDGLRFLLVSTWVHVMFLFPPVHACWDRPKKLIYKNMFFSEMFFPCFFYSFHLPLDLIKACSFMCFGVLYEKGKKMRNFTCFNFF
ncbi:hypothetical protein ABZP36_019865 [Zizania latifolia]